MIGDLISRVVIVDDNMDLKKGDLVESSLIIRGMYVLTLMYVSSLSLPDCEPISLYKIRCFEHAIVMQSELMQTLDILKARVAPVHSLGEGVSAFCIWSL